MKLFLSGQPSEEGRLLVKQIDQALSDLGVIVFTNENQSAQNNNLSFDRLNGLVVTGSETNQDAGYLMALAISQKKPTLYLLRKGTLLPGELSYLQNNKEVSKYLVIKYFDSLSLVKRLAEFVDLLENGDKQWDVPSVKFTLRVTPRIERYLRWQSAHTGKTKADWLRGHIVQEIITQDKEYQKFLQAE